VHDSGLPALRPGARVGPLPAVTTLSAALALGLALAPALAVTPAQASSAAPTPAVPTPALASTAAGGAPDAVEIGRRLFFDDRLSEPRGTSCASCHDPARAFAGGHASAFGVARGSRAGHFARRNTPSLLYLAFVPRFHYYQEEDAPQASPFGGFFWDGRADSIAALVRQPLLNPDEMNNRDLTQIATKLRAAGYTADLQRLFGGAAAGAEDDEDDAAEAVVGRLGRALEAFLTSPAMAPFSSKYDAYVRGRAVLSPGEALGLKLFKDPDKGNCASCHLLTVSSPTPQRSMFTDYGYDAIAVPRNPQLIAARHAGGGFDLGLCERRDRQVPSDDEKWCASFRTPSLRNVAARPAFMHNGAFTNLRDVVAFYATRATDPMRWYKSRVKFDDVPPKLRGQVNINSIPYNRRTGDVAPLDDREVDAIVEFLRTLTDAAYR
jgi:cytochrome c peroxidase